MEQLLETLRCKPGSHKCHWNFSLTLSCSRFGRGFDTAPNRNEHQKCFFGGRGRVKTACALGWQLCHPFMPNVLKSWDSHPPSNPQCLYRDFFILLVLCSISTARKLVAVNRFKYIWTCDYWHSSAKQRHRDALRIRTDCRVFVLLNCCLISTEQGCYFTWRPVNFMVHLCCCI